MLDGSGTLKYADFGLSRVEGEILEELFEKFADAGEMWSNEMDVDNNPLSKKYKTTGIAREKKSLHHLGKLRTSPSHFQKKLSG